MGKRRRWQVLAVAAVAVFMIVWGLPWLFNPWSVAFPGLPALTDHWRGEVTVEPGDRRAVVFELDSYDGRYGTSLEGRGKVCGPSTVEYRLDGETGNWRGTEFELSAHRVGDVRGVLFNTLRGTWDKADELTLEARFTVIDDDGVWRSSTPVPPPARFTMRRATRDDFDTVC